MGALVINGNSILLDGKVQEEAQEAISQVSDDKVADIGIAIGERSITLGHEAAELVMHVLSQVAQGGQVRIRSMPAQLTTTAAAQLLGISRPTLMKQIEAGELRSIKVGSHNRILTSDLQDFRARRLKEKRAAFRELRETSAELESLS